MTARSDHINAEGSQRRSVPDDGTRPVRVTVITIFFNSGRLIEEAIESLLAQTLSDWELLLVDDGSNDMSSSIARNWSERMPEKVRYLEHPGHVNLGMSASRNLGIQSARGEYVAFLDADDVFLPERLERHVQILDTMPEVDLVQSDQIYWYCWSDRKGKGHEALCLRPPLYLGDGVLRAPEALLTLLAVPDAFNAPCSITVRRRVALDLGGFENDFRSLYEDRVFLTKVYANRTVYALQSWLAKYRIHSGGSQTLAAQTAHLRDGVFQAETRRFGEWQAEYLARSAAADTWIRDLLPVSTGRQGASRARLVAILLSIVRRTAHRMARLFLPATVYRDVLQLRQRWSAERSRRDHQTLCRRLSQERLQDSLLFLPNKKRSLCRDRD